MKDHLNLFRKSVVGLGNFIFTFFNVKYMIRIVYSMVAFLTTK